MNEYVLRIECRMKYPHNKRAIFGRLTHLYSGLTLEWWNKQKITKYESNPIVYLTEDVIENVFLPPQPCNISNVETFCPRDIEGTLNAMYHNDLSPPFRKHHWNKYWIFVLCVVLSIQCIFNYFYDKSKHDWKGMMLFVLKELIFVILLSLVLSCLFCFMNLADGAWCF